MGLSYADIILRNPRFPGLEPLKVKAMADTDAVTMCVPKHVAIQLKLDELEAREVTLANGERLTVAYADPVQTTFANRNSFGGAYIMGDEVLLGAIQMEDMDLIVNPKEQKVTVNPESPNIPSAKVKQVSYG